MPKTSTLILIAIAFLLISVVIGAVVYYETQNIFPTPTPTIFNNNLYANPVPQNQNTTPVPTTPVPTTPQPTYTSTPVPTYAPITTTTTSPTH